MIGKFVLYSYWRSSCSWRVRSVLEHKNIPFEYRAVNLFTGEQYGDEFKQINPISQVPTLQFVKDDGKTDYVNETMAIVDLLEHFYPDRSVYPKDPVKRAKVVAFCETIISGIQPLQNLTVMRKVEELTGNKEKGLEWNQYWISKKFELLEKILTDSAGKYTFGDELTFADMCLIPQVYNALKYKVDIEKFPIIKRLYDSLLNEDGPIQKAKPENQPDSPH